MEMTSRQLYNSLIHGAHMVIENKQVLNKINVFPVRDGDTGSNLASMMRHIIRYSEPKETVKESLESIADAALSGARGNSGIIFAQYLNGLSESVSKEAQITLEEYVDASNLAVTYAYEAVETPVEGTMITLMREWGMALKRESSEKSTLKDVFHKAYETIEVALERTKEQLQVLKKANVVDSGAKGFTYFVEGALYYFEKGEEASVLLKTEAADPLVPYVEEEALHTCSHGNRYCTECLMEQSLVSSKEIKKHLATLGDSLVLAGNSRKTRVHIHTDEPADVFDYLKDCGKIVYQKVDDMHHQETIVNQRKYPIALVTDSIADLPKAYMDEEQIHVIHLDILHKDMTYMDKLTIKPDRLLEMSKDDPVLPTSSQPSPKKVENRLDYLSTYYDDIIILTVSRTLSGTYNVIKKSADAFQKAGKRITVIDTKENAIAQGLLVKACAEMIKAGKPYEAIVEETEALIEKSKILVQVKEITNMIKSGRLSVRAGKIAQLVHMKPIITLDKEGKGALETIGFSDKASRKKLLKHMAKVQEQKGIRTYGIVHIVNEAEALVLSQELTDLLGQEPDYITDTSSVVAVGAGKGAVAVGYITH